MPRKMFSKGTKVAHDDVTLVAGAVLLFLVIISALLLYFT